jgi:photosynthetic reaction center cytochrome c subunit
MRRFLLVAVLCVCSFAALTIGHAAQSGQTPGQPQAQQPGPQAGEEKAGQSKQFTNIQVLKDIPADQLLPSMQFIKAALGVDCGFCHVTDKGHEGYAADDKRNKKTAREMMTMTIAINQNNFKGEQRVTCATCHNGHNNPNPVAPVLDEARWQERVDARARTAAQNRPAAPGQTQQQSGGRPNPQAMQAAADAIVARYVDAIGGQAAIEKLTSLAEKGNITTPHGDSAQFELKESAPNKVLFVRTPGDGPAMRIAYNGQDAAAMMGGHANPIHGFELQALKLDANFSRNFNLKEQYTRMQSPPFPQKIDGREVKMVRGVLPDNQGQETLYFESQSGLLVRRVSVLRTALGGIPQQYDYSDYRDVNGVKIPFVTKLSTSENIQTRTITEARFNVPVDDKDFFMAANSGASSGGN